MYGEYYKVRIYAGYRRGNIVKIFDGAVSYISNAIHSAHDWECYINFASDVVANYSQKRINFNLNSSINYWTALDQICRLSGITDVNISEDFKDYVLNESYKGYKSFSTVLDANTFNTSGEFEIPSIPALPDIPDSLMPDLPDILDSLMPGLPDILDSLLPELPGILDSLDIPDLPDLPDMPDMPGTLDFSDIPGVVIDSILLLDFKDFVSVPFEYEGYEIEFVQLKNGRLNLALSTDLTLVRNVVLSTDNIKMGNGSNMEIALDFTKGLEQEVNLDLTNCIIAPENKNITFSATLVLDVPFEEGFEGGLYTVDVNGGIMDVEFKTIDGKISDFVFDFIGSHDFDFSIPNVDGNLKVATPEFSIKYVNTFGFRADGVIDSLYLSDDAGNMTSLIKDGQRVELSLHSTGGAYDSISELDEKLVDDINILQGFNKITFNGNSGKIEVYYKRGYLSE